jgi:NADH:ubiquinone oxidoreductase subunit 4 (subunit M)
MLTALILTPLVGALLLTTMSENSTQAITRIKQMTLLVTVLVFAIAMLL